MRVIVIGGAGQRGEATSYLLSQETSIAQLVIADKRMDTAARLAERLGSRVEAVAIDLHDATALDRLLEGADLLVNATGPYRETLEPCLRAAMRAGVNYCDFSDDCIATQTALALDRAAREARISAIIGMGVSPGLTNLMAMHAATQLDRVEAIELGWGSSIEAFSGDIDENLDKAHRFGRASAVMEQFFYNASGKVPIYRDGKSTVTDGFSTLRRLPMPEGYDLTCCAFGSAEVLTLPHYLPDLRSVEHFVGMLPEQLNRLLSDHCRRVASGELDERHATVAVFEAMAHDRQKWLARPDDMVPGALFVIAKGTKGGRGATYSCAPAWSYATRQSEVGVNSDLDTAAVLALTAMKLLDGSFHEHGAFPPEASFDPLSFMAELSRRWGALPESGKLLTETFVANDA